MKRSWKLRIRRAHRWIAVGVGVQLIAWIVGGLYFSVMPIDVIRGEHLLSSNGALDPATLRRIAPASQWDLGASPIVSATIVADGAGPVLLATTEEGVIAIELATGARRAPLDPQQAAAVAAERLTVSSNVENVARLTSVPLDHEYRGRPLPAYQIRFDHDSGARVYVSESTGQVTALRTDYWRIFDFLWMLHIMDYDSRDNFNHPLLVTAGSLALLAAAAGVITWWTSTPLWRRMSGWRRRRRPSL